jgi:uncharacterized protein YqfA (UPF0365 family)
MDVTLLILAGAIILFFIILFTIIPVGLWISAIAAGVKVSLTSASSRCACVGCRLTGSSCRSSRPTRPAST